LRGGARDLPVRQQTLRDTIDWSYDLLDAREQTLFKLLAVFSGVTLEAVEAVTIRLQPFDEFDIFEAVSSLADKSLIRHEEAAQGEARLRMLETIREYAAARLEEDTAFNAEARRAHATFFAEFTASQWAQLTGEGRERALTLLTVELENIRTAWRYWAAQGNLEQLGKFTDSLWLLYDARGWYHATVELTTELLHVLATTVSTPERARQEITLQTSLARALLATKGYTAEVEQAYARALELCANAGEIPEVFPVLRGLASFYVLRSEFEKGHGMGERILELAERLDDMDMRVEGHLVLGENIASLGDLHLGLEHLEKAIVAFDPKRHRVRRLGLGSNPGVVALNVSALYLWMLGFPERAHKRAEEAVALAQKLDHSFSMCYALFHYGYLNLWSGNTQAAQASGRRLMNLAAEHDFQIWSAIAACLSGAAMAGAGAINEGLALIEPGIIEYRALKTPPVFWPLLLGMQAGAYAAASRPADGLPLIDEALQIGMANQGKILAPEIIGMKGDLLLAIDAKNAPEAEGLFQFALNIAQEVKAPMLELRVAMKLSRLWQAQDKTEPARTLLSAAYAKMTEGFAMADLMQAQAILKELG
jgi:predicted ATPase